MKFVLLHLQVLAGALLGAVAGRWAAGAKAPTSGCSKAVAQSVADGSGAPRLAPALTRPPAQAPPGIRPVVQTACAFGNSLTMPLLYLLTLFPGAAEAATVTGFTALILLGWSPLFWTFGCNKVMNAMNDGSESRNSAAASPAPTTQMSAVRWRPAGGFASNGAGRPSTAVTIDTAAAPAPHSNGSSSGSGGAQRGDGSDGNGTGRRQLPAPGALPEQLPDDMADLPELLPAEPSTDVSSTDESVDDDEPHYVLGTRSRSAKPAEIVQEAECSALVHRPERPSPRIAMTPIADPDAQPEVQLPMLRKANGGQGRRTRSWRARLMQQVGDEVSADSAKDRKWLEALKRIANPPIVAACIGVLLGCCPLGAPAAHLQPEWYRIDAHLECTCVCVHMVSVRHCI